MASKKKPSEGIALLSMYNDDEMEDAEEEDDEEGDAGMHREQQQEDAAGDARFTAEEDSAADADRTAVVDSGNEAADAGSTPALQTDMLVLSPQDSRIGRKGALTIVDYGHDEVAMSPDPEEGEIYGTARVTFGDQLHVTNGDLLDRTQLGTVQVLTPSNQDQIMQNLEKHIKTSKYLKIHWINFSLHHLKLNAQRSYNFNAEVRNRKDYRNPDFLLHAVSYQDIDQIGSCFSKDVFDPHGYDPSDFYDEIEADMRCESERKEQEKKKAQKVEFISGGGAPRIGMPVAGSETTYLCSASAVSTSGLPLVPPPADSINQDGRQNKKSKWDMATKMARGRGEKIL